MAVEDWTPDEIEHALPTPELREAFRQQLWRSPGRTVGAVVARWAAVAQKHRDAVNTTTAVAEQVAAGTFDWDSTVSLEDLTARRDARRRRAADAA